MPSSLASSLYEKLIEEEDARVCKDISDQACRVVPGNFLLILNTFLLTKLGDALVNPKTVLAWLIGVLNAPVYLLGFLVPIRESGSLIPQLFIASFIRRMPVRKWAWVSGSVIQGLAVSGMAWCALTLDGITAGWVLISLLIVFSLARGVCSVASKDVLGKTIPKTRRGQVAGISAGVAGGVTIAAGVFMSLDSGSAQSLSSFIFLITGAALCWFLASLLYATVNEFPGETGGGGNAISEAWQRLTLLTEDKPFLLFVVVRSLLLCSALTAPYYVALAQENLGQLAYLLGLFVIADGCASLISAPLWGRFADRSARQVMIAAAGATSCLGFLTFILLSVWPQIGAEIWLYPALFFVLSIAHSGVRLGRKTYVVDLASGNRRTDYVAVSNTVIGVVLLFTGIIGFVASSWSILGVIVVLSILAMVGALTALRLPEVQSD